MFGVVTSQSFLSHEGPSGHPESPERIRSLLSWFAPGGKYGNLLVPLKRSAELSDLARVHQSEMVQKVCGTLGKTGYLDPDTFFSPKSFEASTLAVGMTIDLALKVWDGEFTRGFSIVRPPGHHATPNASMGFCLFNNIALAAAAVRSRASRPRVAIVDFDLHHGNGTQDTFYADENVLFISSHRFPFYPGTGARTETGEGKGLGTTLNLPLDAQYSGKLIIPLYESIVFPVLEEYKPDMIFVSAGFDGHRDDPMQGLRLSDTDFKYLSERLVELAEKFSKGRIFFCLEGGYDPQTVANSCDSLIRLLCTPQGVPGKKASLSEVEAPQLYDELVEFHRSVWSL